MVQLSKSVINNQVYALATTHYAELLAGNDDMRRRALSKAYTLLSTMILADIDEESVADAVVDGNNDMAIDAIVVEEPQNEFFNVHLFQTKYSEDLAKDKGFPESDVLKVIDTLRKILQMSHFEINSALDLNLSQFRAHVDEFNIPNFYIYLCNNGQGLSTNAQARIDMFLQESPENAKRYHFRYVNHQDIFSALEKTEPVNCTLEFSGSFIDEAIHFKRAFVGKVPVAMVADLLTQHGNRLMQKNVRDFLGFNRIVNQGIRSTLLDAEKRPDFYFLNNGITMVCEKLDYAQGANGVRARLSNAQIINGGQTSRTIEQVITEYADIDFSKVYVLVRAYQVNMDDQGDLIHDITIATNSQNSIFARDLHANDPVQKRLESGLQHYGVRYLRRRDARRAKADDIRMEVAAECLVTLILNKPIAAKYRKILHFTDEYYPEIFSESRVNPEIILFGVQLFKRIESQRKRVSVDILKKYPFIPFASHYLLRELYQTITNGVTPSRENISSLLEAINDQGQFDGLYNDALQTFNLLLTAYSSSDIYTLDALKMSMLMKEDGFERCSIKAKK